MKCPYCKEGKVTRLINSEGFHFNSEEPIEEEEPCEECGGTGKLPEVIIPGLDYSSNDIPIYPVTINFKE